MVQSPARRSWDGRVDNNTEPRSRNRGVHAIGHRASINDIIFPSLILLVHKASRPKIMVVMIQLFGLVWFDLIWFRWLVGLHFQPDHTFMIKGCS